MKTVAIISQKGGTGKTTVAVHLSVEATRAGHKVALIDLDPQASATKWSITRSADAPIAVSAHAVMLRQELYKAEQAGVDLAIIDTPPNQTLFRWKSQGLPKALPTSLLSQSKTLALT